LSLWDNRPFYEQELPDDDRNIYLPPSLRGDWGGVAPPAPAATPPEVTSNFGLDVSQPSPPPPEDPIRELARRSIEARLGAASQMGDTSGLEEAMRQGQQRATMARIGGLLRAGGMAPSGGAMNPAAYLSLLQGGQNTMAAETARRAQELQQHPVELYMQQQAQKRLGLGEAQKATEEATRQLDEERKAQANKQRNEIEQQRLFRQQAKDESDEEYKRKRDEWERKNAEEMRKIGWANVHAKQEKGTNTKPLPTRTTQVAAVMKAAHETALDLTEKWKAVISAPDPASAMARFIEYRNDKAERLASLGAADATTGNANQATLKQFGEGLPDWKTALHDRNNPNQQYGLKAFENARSLSRSKHRALINAQSRGKYDMEDLDAQHREMIETEVKAGHLPVHVVNGHKQVEVDGDVYQFD